MLLVSLESVLIEYVPGADNTLKRVLVSVDHIRGMASEHLFTCTSMMLQWVMSEPPGC